MRVLISLVMLFLPIGLAVLKVDGWAIAGVGIAACAATACLCSGQAQASPVDYGVRAATGSEALIPQRRKCPSDDDPVILPMHPR